MKEVRAALAKRRVKGRDLLLESAFGFASLDRDVVELLNEGFELCFAYLHRSGFAAAW